MLTWGMERKQFDILRHWYLVIAILAIQKLAARRLLGMEICLSSRSKSLRSKIATW